ncbi:HU family DNA-binding protein [Bacteroides thetaiotaomicron]|uniref:HU family DNA-binding protein n=1 Tax=Bacteroides thetaiotaomicron TaxID=818 RepID=UPI0039C131C5
MENVLNHITDTVRDSLHNEESVTLVGFGTFRVQERAARQGYNPSAGRKMQIPAKKIVKFKPGKALEIK